MTSYIKTGNPIQGGRGISKFIRDEFAAIETAVNSKANIDSPALTGTPTAPTATTGDSSTQIATTEFVANTSFTTNLPAQSGNADGGLLTDGTNASWSSRFALQDKANTFTEAITMNESFNTARATVASHATNADIWGAAGNEIDFTGTATITDFPNAPQAGISRILHIAGTPTFTHNANITVSGGATYTCRAGDIVLVHSITATTFRVTIFPYDYEPQVTLGIINAETLGRKGVSSGERIDEYTYNTGLATGSIGLSFGASLFVAFTSASSDKVATSPDGETWTLRTMPSAREWYVGYGSTDKFLAIARSVTVAAKSADGITWTSVTALPGNAASSFNNVPRQVGSTWLVNSSVASTAYLSTDYGASWSTETLPAVNGSASFYVVNGLFFFWSSATTAYTSATGVTGSWTSRTLPANGSATVFHQNPDGSITYNDGLGNTHRTTDGINWSIVSTLSKSGTSNPSLYLPSGVIAEIVTTAGECFTLHNGVRVLRNTDIVVTNGARLAHDGSSVVVIGSGSSPQVIKLTNDLPNAVFR